MYDINVINKTKLYLRNDNNQNDLKNHKTVDLPYIIKINSRMITNKTTI